MANVELGSSNLKEVYDAINSKGDLDTSNLAKLNAENNFTQQNTFSQINTNKIVGDYDFTIDGGNNGHLKFTTGALFELGDPDYSIGRPDGALHGLAIIADANGVININSDNGVRFNIDGNASVDFYQAHKVNFGAFPRATHWDENYWNGLEDDMLINKKYVHTKAFDYKHNYAPTLNVNPSSTGVTWHDTKENEIYVCIDNTANNNKWVGNKSGYVGGSYVTANPGEAGFGCGVAPSEIVSKYNMTPMEGTYNPNSKNYGNYTDRTGSVMVWIPKVYVKYTYDTAEPYYGHKVEVSNTPKADYFLPRCFINNGKEIDGFFIDKYACSPENKIGVSKRYGQPLCTHPNGIDVLSNLELPSDVVSALSLSNGTILNRADALPLAAKTRGVHYSLPTAFMFHHLADLVDAHYFATKTATDNFLGGYSLCAWADRAPYAPKGPNNNNLTDYFDFEVVFQLSTNNNGNSYKTARCGSCDDSVFPKITHNGQWCGVADMNGVIWQGALGLVSNASANICIMKESTNATDIVTSNLYDYSLYDEITSLSYYKTSVKGQNYYPTTGQLWSNETSRTTDVYKLQSVGFPSSLIAGQNNNNRYGCDSVWLNYGRQQLFPYYLNCGWDSLRAGVRSLHFHTVHSYSDVTHGFRACIIPD